MLKKTALSLLCALLSACAAMSGPPLIPGTTTLDEVVARHGAPAMRLEVDGGERLAWPSGPMGTSTIMASFDSKRRLKSYEEVLDMKHFSGIQAGMSMDDVLRLIGPPYAGWTTYFKARDELVWEWRYCDDWSNAARFNVMFDGTSKKVRSTMSLTEGQRFYRREVPCGHAYIQVGPAAVNLK